MVVPGPNGGEQTAGNGCLPTTPQSPATKDKSEADKNKVEMLHGYMTRGNLTNEQSWESRREG